MARTPGEFYEDAKDRLAKPLIYTAGLTGALVLMWSNTDYPWVEPSAKQVAETVLGTVGLVAPWENDHNQQETTQQGGKMALSTFAGSFIVHAEAQTSMKSEIVGNVISESKTAREGYIVNRLKFPGIPTLDWKADEDVMYISRFENGDDVGIPINKAVFEMLNPETATENDGILTCSREMSDPEYNGCVESATVRVGFLAYFPGLGEDENQNLQIAGERLFDEFGKLEECHFDNDFIPIFNQIYEVNGIPKQLDGPDAYSEAARTMVRYFLRESIAEQTPPQRVFINFSGTYTPIPSVIERVQTLSEAVDFPFQLGEDIEPNYCSSVESGQSSLAITGEQDLDMAYLKIAIGGLEQVPEGFNIQTGAFEEGKYAAANLDTTLGDFIKGTVLGAS